MLELQNGFIEQSMKNGNDVLIKVGLDILYNLHDDLLSVPNGTFSTIDVFSCRYYRHVEFNFAS